VKVGAGRLKSPMGYFFLPMYSLAVALWAALWKRGRRREALGLLLGMLKPKSKLVSNLLLARTAPLPGLLPLLRP
jgi:hypothetical protein